MLLIATPHISISIANLGYIAGSSDGIVTVKGQPASRKIWLLNAQTMSVDTSQWSLPNGRYAFFGLDDSKEYLVMVRDYKKEYEPFAWDYVKPADDLTVAEQQALWQTWQ